MVCAQPRALTLTRAVRDSGLEMKLRQALLASETFLKQLKQNIVFMKFS
jgi:hypothetical protein